MNPTQKQSEDQVYANDPDYMESPSATNIDRGVKPLDTLPAAWWNWLWNRVTSQNNNIRLDVSDIRQEIISVLSGAADPITPNENQHNQLYQAIQQIRKTIGTAAVPGAVTSSSDIKSVSINGTSGAMLVNALADWATSDTIKKVLDKMESDRTAAEAALQAALDKEATARGNADVTANGLTSSSNTMTSTLTRTNGNMTSSAAIINSNLLINGGGYANTMRSSVNGVENTATVLLGGAALSSTNKITTTNPAKASAGIIQVHPVYLADGPANYGNLINVGGAGGTQIFQEWSGNQNSADQDVEQHLWIRSQRHNQSAFTAWKKVANVGDIASTQPSSLELGGTRNSVTVNINGKSATATLSPFIATSDGLVPAPGSSNTNKFLRGDGTWQDIAITYGLGAESSSITVTDMVGTDSLVCYISSLYTIPIIGTNTGNYTKMKFCSLTIHDTQNRKLYRLRATIRFAVQTAVFSVNFAPITASGAESAMSASMYGDSFSYGTNGVFVVNNLPIQVDDSSDNLLGAQITITMLEK